MNTVFLTVEKYRARVRRLHYVKLTDAQLRLRARRDEAAAQELALAGAAPGPEETALYAMFQEERLPDPIREWLLAEWISETLPTPGVSGTAGGEHAPRP